MNSKGFRMRRDHEAKQELNISTPEDRRNANPERPISEQDRPDEQDTTQRSLIGRIWRAIRR